MADSVARPDGREPTGSLTNDAGDPSLARGAAGMQSGVSDVLREGRPEAKGDLEERRETEQVVRPTTDGMGEGLVKDQG